MALSRDVQSALRCILSIIYTASADLHETCTNTNPINHTQVRHSYLALSYQLSREELKPSSQTFQSTNFPWLFELGLGKFMDTNFESDHLISTIQ